MLRKSRVKHIYIMPILLTIAVSLIPSTTVASDSCSDLIKSTNGGKTAFLKTLAGYFSQGQSISLPPPTAGNVYFTTGSGRALTPTCEPHGRALPVLYYPAGISVIKISSVTVSGRRYAFVVTEYGMLVLIPEADLQPLEEKATYLFVDGPRDVPYTLASTPQDPTVKSKCPALAGLDNLSKLTAGSANGTARYGRILKSSSISNCSTFTFVAMERGRVVGNQPLFISECWAGFQPPPQEAVTCKVAPMKLKTVTLADENKSFEGARASFGHFSLSFAKLWPGVSNIKKCPGLVKIDTVSKAGVGGDYYVFNASINATFEVQDELPDEEYYYFNHYNREDKNAEGVYGVASIVSCDKSLLTNFEEVEVYGNYGDQDSFLVEAQELTNTWKQVSGLEGYSQPIALSDLYKQGRFLDVNGPVEYFNLRDVLRTYLKGLDEIKAVQDLYDSPETKMQILDFYTHLVMAAIAHLPSSN